MAHRRTLHADACASPRNSLPQTHTREIPEQLPLRYNDRYLHHEAWDELLDELSAIVAAVGLKQVAFDLDEQPSVLAHALIERERHTPKMRWLHYIVTKSPTDRIVQLIAAWRGLIVQPRKELTPAEERDRLKAAIDDVLGHDVAELVHKKAGLR